MTLQARRGSQAEAPYPRVVVRAGEQIVAERMPEPAATTPSQWDLSFSFNQPGHYNIELVEADGTIGTRALLEVLALPTEADNSSADPEALAERNATG